jgi:hypothetical protein
MHWQVAFKSVLCVAPLTTVCHSSTFVASQSNHYSTVTGAEMRVTSHSLHITVYVLGAYIPSHKHVTPSPRCLETLRLKYTEPKYYPWFCMEVKLALSHEEKNSDWGCLRTGCWGGYLDLTRTKWKEDGENCVKRHFIICAQHTVNTMKLGRIIWDTHGEGKKSENCVENSGLESLREESTRMT